MTSQAAKVAAETRPPSKVDASSVRTATSGSAPRSAGGCGITAELDVKLPGLSDADAKTLVEVTHGICPYSNAIRPNVDVKTTTHG